MHALPPVLDHAAASELRRILLDDDARGMTLDASALRHVTLPGLQVLIAAARAPHAVRVTHVPDELRPLLDAAGVAPGMTGNDATAR